jgi:hypothetical protein
LAASWGIFSSAESDWIRGRKANNILQLATQKCRDLPGVPWSRDFTKTAAERQILDLIFSRRLMACPWTDCSIARGVRSDHEDPPDLLTETRAQMYDIDPFTAGELTAFLRSAYAGQPDAISFARPMIMEGT